MYDIQQFKPSLYVVVLVGMTGYAVAAEAPALWLFAVVLVMTNVWMTRQGTFRPIPRLLAGGVTLLAAAYAILQIRAREVESPILAIGQFLVLLQVVKVWEQRANRDYAQLLILSLLLMVAAAISTASLLFGFLFVAYLLASLYCCLLFHLKIETEDARAAAGFSPADPRTARPAAVPPAGQDPTAAGATVDGRRNLSGSMRRLTGLIAAYALVSAVAVFLFFPRGPGAGLFGQYMWKPNKTLTGFSEQVSFQQVARITQNNDQVGTVRVVVRGKAQPFGGLLMLRGYTDDYYSGANDGDRGAYQWSHAPDTKGRWWETMTAGDAGAWRARGLPEDAPAAPIRQEFELSPTGTQVLFALAGANRVKIEDPKMARKVGAQYGVADETLRSDDVVNQPLRYTVESTGDLGDEDVPPHAASVIDPEIARFARRADVTGGLAAERDRLAAARPDGGARPFVSPLDGQIADRIEAYLKHNYAYTLDLTDIARVQGRDPMVAFLTDFKKGHCEYFAGAMTLLCQSLGMQSRLVVGFKCDDYNQFGGFYTIRQSQAHAWTEVRTRRGWVGYDPTGGTELATASVSTWQRAKNLLDYMEYTWQRAVIAYNSDNRDNLIQSVDAKLNTGSAKGSSLLARVREMLRLDMIGDTVASNVVGPIVGLLVAVLLGTVGYFALDRLKMRRRAARIGLNDLPADAQARLVRQLAFYDGLVQLLARHRITRPPHLTPLEFSRSLSFLPPQAYEVVGRLTEVFYRIRFGGADVDDGRQRRLVGVVGRLEGLMPGGDAGPR